MNEAIPVLQTEQLTKSYGKIRGIVDINLSVMQGDIFGFIGPNGAGKSTTIRSIMGLLFPDSGTIRIFGKNPEKKSALIRKSIGFVPSELNFYSGLKVRDLLKYSSDLYGVNNIGIMKELSERLQLDLGRSINDLSLGNRKKVAIIQALIHEPELIILDEPTSGLDPLIQSEFYTILKEQKERGATLFFSSHTLSEVERLCNRVAIIKDGQIIKISGVEKLKQMNMKRFKLFFKNENSVPYNLKESIPGINSIQIIENRIEGLYRGDIAKFMKYLSGLSLRDAVLEDPGLDEIFMHYYKKEEKKI